MWWVSFCRQWRSKTGSRKKRVRIVAISSLPFVSSETVWALSWQHFDNLFSLPKCIEDESFSFSHPTYTSFWLPPFHSMHRQWSAFSDVWVKPYISSSKKMNAISLWRHVSPPIDYKNNNSTSWDKGVPAERMYALDIDTEHAKFCPSVQLRFLASSLLPSL